MLQTISPVTEKAILNQVVQAEKPIWIASGLSRFVTLESLGSGTYGNVSVVLDVERFQTVVILKRMSKTGTKLLDAEVEVAALKLVLPICKKSTICFDGFFEDQENYYITTKTDGKDTQTVHDFLGSVPRKSPSVWPTLVTVINNMIQCTRDFFSVGLTHRDLKPANMIMSEDLTVRSIDFGMACWSNSSCQTRFRVGTYQYLAPEMLLLIKSGSKSFRNKKLKLMTLRDFWRVDIYALGISIYEVLFRQRPFEKHYPTFKASDSLLNVLNADLISFYNTWSFSGDLAQNPEIAELLTKEGLSPSYLDKFVTRNPKLRKPFPLPTFGQIENNLQRQEEEAAETETEGEEETIVDDKIDMTPADLWQQASQKMKWHADQMAQNRLIRHASTKSYRSMFVNLFKLLVLDAIEFQFAPAKPIDRAKGIDYFYDDLVQLYALSVKQFQEILQTTNDFMTKIDSLYRNYGAIKNPKTVDFTVVKMVFLDSQFVVTPEDREVVENMKDLTQLVEVIMQSKTMLPFPLQANLHDWLQKTRKALFWLHNWLKMVNQYGVEKTMESLEQTYSFERSPDQIKMMETNEYDELWLDVYFGSDVDFPDPT